MCLNTGRPKNINFSFETNGKLMAFGVPILKHFRVCQMTDSTDPHDRAPDTVRGVLRKMQR